MKKVNEQTIKLITKDIKQIIKLINYINFYRKCPFIVINML